MVQLPISCCSRAVCQPPCLRHARCPYEKSEEDAKWRALLKKGKVVGPVQEWTGIWMATVERWDPWGEALNTASRVNG